MTNNRSDAHVSQHYPRVSQHYQKEFVDALRYAGAMGRIDMIDELTDLLVGRGLARPRSDDSMFESIAGTRNPHPGTP